MEYKQQAHINISSPNLVNICVDKTENGELSGRVYHCYRKGPEEFVNLMHLINQMDAFFDCISFPQASTKPRYFVKHEAAPMPKPQKVQEQKEIIRYTGILATFVTCVKFRQNSAWQGELFWVEQGETYRFFSTLEFIKQVDWALENPTAKCAKISIEKGKAIGTAILE